MGFYSHSRRILRASEARELLAAKFVAGPGFPFVPALTEAQKHRELNNLEGVLIDAGCGDQEILLVKQTMITVWRLAEEERIPYEVARHIVCGQATSENKHSSFDSVPFYALLPHALRALDPKQQDVCDPSKLVVPPHFHQWILHEGARQVSRISIQTTESVHDWMDRVVALTGGKPQVVALICFDKERTDVLPEGKSNLLSLELVGHDSRYLVPFSDNFVPEDLADFFKVVQTSDSFKSIHDKLTLAPYKSF